ncbi:MAG: hypothetical protein UX91_C0001G0042 [Candidatus Amesbacteria bacterium GW2011_GWB1_47_19]|nr:MAG: hypothetical protein UW51_C0001G0042 [Candidatus Amesbacteria bacterium GW2011_GWA1_44_24]KKU32054.1 MAG: hypothetical protein UX46_C0001G0041 [Candidatus Amesbacteria bacterium GW2011_GWC1_46_24]KKU67738.1 MAG: hypothetical protein UX91_C0001G0042 [Candidatus Amesbacteria bacterium GW2011_GWB1_47_19]
MSRGRGGRTIGVMKNREQTISFIGVVVMALVLPGILKLANNAVRYWVGAEGRLAAIAVETDRTLGPLPGVWRGLAQGGENLPTFLDQAGPQVAALKPAVVRIDHIYDEFEVVSRGSGGLVFDWTRLDVLAEKIKATGADPFFSLSYMPAAIASGDLTSLPRDWNEWSMVVQKTIEHYSGEKGWEGIYYEVWNEPDLFGQWKMAGKKDYRSLYYYAAKGAAAAQGVKDFKLGGPSTTGLYPNWLNNFFPFVLNNKLRLDFFSWHRYDLNMSKYAEDVQNVDRWIEGHPYFSQVEKVVTEMAPRSEPGQENDSRLGAAHLVAASRELMFRVQYALSFAVTGQWGIIGKPRYEALAFLSGLGEQRLGITGEGSWVRAIGAKKNEVYQVILTNYDPKGVHSEVVPVTFINLKDYKYQLRTTYLGARTQSEEIASAAGIMQKSVPMSPNSVVMLELEPVTNTQAPSLNSQ